MTLTTMVLTTMGFNRNDKRTRRYQETMILRRHQKNIKYFYGVITEYRTPHVIKNSKEWSWCNNLHNQTLSLHRRFQFEQGWLP